MPLASLKQRLAGALIDAAIMLAPYVVLREFPGDPVMTLVALALLAAIFSVQGYFLTRDGQTLGKKAAKTRVVRVDTDRNGGFVTNVLLRGVLGTLPNALGLYMIADPLFVFRKDRRCLHDFIGGTKVVDVSSEA